MFAVVVAASFIAVDGFMEEEEEVGRLVRLVGEVRERGRERSY